MIVGSNPAPSDGDGGAAGAGPAWSKVPFDLEEEGRYTRNALLGAGGMGRVYAATDRRLGRQVALKELHEGADTPSAVARLVREAWVTAALDHPAIVPVHDAGRTRDGALFYTMRLVRGRTLAAALAEASTPDARLGLVRVVLDACRAVAFAHERGVIHRDLKPANLLIGAFGETQVADWGLARRLDEVDPNDGEGAVPGVDDPGGATLTRYGAVVGTPGYMAPEQVAGAPLTTAVDVFALGVVLHEVLMGGLPGTSPGPGAVTPAVQPELWAIVHRATVAEASARYPDAGRLAEDLDAWFTGRRVSAHAYTPADLLRRLWAAWRVPIVVGAVGLLSVGVVGVLAFGETARERDRAREAEQVAETALGEADRSLALALRGRATGLLARGAAAEASILAARAAALDASPEAVGAWMDALGAPLPRQTGRAPLACERPATTGEGTGVLCRDGGTVTWVDAATGAQAWSVDGMADAGMAGPGQVLLVGLTGELRLVRASDGGTLATRMGDAGLRVAPHRTTVGPLALGGERLWTELGAVVRYPCADGAPGPSGVTPIAVLGAPGAAEVLVACSDGRAVRFDGARVSRAPGLSALGHTDVAVGERLTDGGLVFGTLHGLVVHLGADGRRRWEVDAGVGRVWSLTVLQGGRYLAVAGDQGDVVLLDGRTGGRTGRLPWVSGAPVVLDGGADEASVRLHVVRGGHSTWELPVAPPQRTAVPGSLTWVGRSAFDGSWWTTASNGGVWRLEASDGALARAGETAEVLKVAAPSPDGRWVATGVARPGGQVLMPAGGGSPLRYEAGLPVRRAGWLDAERGWAATSAPTLIGFSVGGEVRTVQPSTDALSDVAPIPGGLLTMARSGDLARVGWALPDDGGPPVWSVEASMRPEPGAQAVFGHSELPRWGVVHRDAVVWADGDGPRFRLATPGGELVRAVLSPDGTHLAVGTVVGEVVVFRLADGAVVARSRRHRERVSWLAWEGDALVSVSWDGDLVRGEASVLRQDPAAAAAMLEARLGLGIREALQVP